MAFKPRDKAVRKAWNRKENWKIVSALAEEN